MKRISFSNEECDILAVSFPIFGIPRFILVGGLIALSVLVFMFGAVHEMHHEVQEHTSQSASGGAPVPASPE